MLTDYPRKSIEQSMDEPRRVLVKCTYVIPVEFPSHWTDDMIQLELRTKCPGTGFVGAAFDEPAIFNQSLARKTHHMARSRKHHLRSIASDWLYYAIACLVSIPSLRCTLGMPRWIEPLVARAAH